MERKGSVKKTASTCPAGLALYSALLALLLMFLSSCASAAVTAKMQYPPDLRQLKLEADGSLIFQGRHFIPNEEPKADPFDAERLPGIDTALPVKSLRVYAPGKQSYTDYPVLALTLDACGGRVGGNCDTRLLTLLEDLHIPATFFLTPGWIAKNPECFARIIENPSFEVGMHGLKHRPAFTFPTSVYGIASTASEQELREEVWGGEKAIRAKVLRQGHDPKQLKLRWFRSGTAAYDQEAVNIIRAGGLRIAGYTVSLDLGASLPEEMVYRRTIAAQGGDILLAHMNHPDCGTGAGLIRALPELLERGAVFVPLSTFFPD